MSRKSHAEDRAAETMRNHPQKTPPFAFASEYCSLLALACNRPIKKSASDGEKLSRNSFFTEPIKAPSSGLFGYSFVSLMTRSIADADEDEATKEQTKGEGRTIFNREH